MNRDYDIFEKLPSGQVLWHEVSTGRERAIERVKQLAAESPSQNEFLAMHLPTKEVIAVASTRSSGDK